MPKMILERFREIKARTAEIFELLEKIDNEEITVTETEEQALQEEYENLSAEIHSKDLSDIPFEEYDGFYDLGFNFEGTGANLDFNIIDTSNRYGTFRLKGCNIRNFDFNEAYDDETFDESFMQEHRENFLNKEVQEDVKKRFYRKILSIEDVLRYDLYENVSQDRLSIGAKNFFDKVPIDVAKSLDIEIFNTNTFSYTFRQRVENFEGSINETTLENILRETAESILSNRFLSLDLYKELLSIPKVHEIIPESSLIDFGDNNDLARKYLIRDISLRDIWNNREIFREKSFIQNLQDYEYEPIRYGGITEEKLFYIFDKYPDVANSLKSNSEHILDLAREFNLYLSEEKNKKNISSKIIEICKTDRNLEPETKTTLERYYSLDVIASSLDESNKYYFDSIMRYTTEEKIASYGIQPKIFEDSSVINLFYIYGLETVMEFDRANGNVFSKNDFAFAKKMFEYYFHYAGNVFDKDRTIYCKSDKEDYHAPYTMEEMQEAVRRMILYGPTDFNYSNLQPIDFRDFSKDFKNKFPDMFISEASPKELQDKFYSRTLEIGDFAIHPEWIDFLAGKNLEIGMKMPSIFFKKSEREDEISFYEAIKEINSQEPDILKFMVDNSKTIKLIERYYSRFALMYIENFDNIKNLDEFKDNLEKEIETKILAGIMEYGEPYIPEFFRKKHPELVLAEDAPEELKAKYYSLYFEKADGVNKAGLQKLTLEDLVNEEYKPFLEGKSFNLLRENDIIKNITQVFGLDTISRLYKIDQEALEIYCLNLENANTLKEVLQKYPEQYAKEELMQGLRLSDEEFKSKLQEEEFKAKFESLKAEYEKSLVSNPGFTLYLPEENKSKETLKQYEILSSSNMLHSSNNYLRDTYEQILGHMFGFLGYEEAKKLLAIPVIDEDTLSRIYEQDEIIKSLYEKKFEITGNIKIIGKLLEGVPNLMPTAEKITSKTTCKAFMSINRRMQEGYNGDIRTLLIEALEENNIPVDIEKINDLAEKVIGISTIQKLEKVREHNSVLIDTSIEENQKTKNMLKIHYRNALEYSLKNSERIDSSLVREYLQKEFSRTRENGDPYYSGHITSHLEDLVNFSKNLSENPEWSKKLNSSVTDNLKEESEKIGKGWIRKITTNVCNKPEKLSYEEAERLDFAIYPEGSKLEVETKATVGLKKLSKEEKEKIYKLLTNNDYKGLFTYGKAENMFSSLNYPYSQKFKEFFLKYEEEFISNPDLYSKFTVMASKFDNYLEEVGFNTRFTEGTLVPEEILLKMSSEVYPNIEVKNGEHELIYQAKDAGLTEEQVKIALNLFEDMRKREYQTIPQERAETKKFRGRIVNIDDPIHFSIGEITNCCQTIGNGQPGESSMIHSATERNGALFIVEELGENGKPIGIISQSWTWRNGNRVCFDNVEIPHKVLEQLRQTGGFDEIVDIYKETAEKMIDTDKAKLKKLVEQGKITKEQYGSMVIKDVAIGLGCDDLIGNLSKEKRSSMKSIPIVAPLEFGKTYTGASRRVLYSDAKSNVVGVAHNDDFANTDHIHYAEDVGSYGVKYEKTRDIFRRRGFDIDRDKLEMLSSIAQKEDRESIFRGSPSSISSVARKIGIEDIGFADADKLKIDMSDSGDWYIFSEETANGILILESGIDTSKPETELEKQDRKMAIGEYTKEIYEKMLEASSKGKAVTIDSYSLEKFVNEENFSRAGIKIEENGIFTVENPEKLKQKIEDYKKVLDTERRERLVITEKDEVEKV